MTREKILLVAKPILFNTENVLAILEGKKTVTRRVIKPQPANPRWNNIGWIGWDDGHGYQMRVPFQTGDYMYVREKWGRFASGKYTYRADYIGADGRNGWHPNIHMPKEAARIFLRVKDVKVERLKDMTADSAMSEGFTDWNDVVRVWDSTIKPKNRDKYGWTANPYVWVIEFERVEVEE